ncbi:MFS transporter [Paenibacillus sp. PCH8]|uniref:MFS transporter n=1 Tax=Paenibacillus sp. PCH8 TaxID=2066524 RepID=UPI000CF8564C|nr:MFS transporter [Paenibacillus sp. PCH8]PQP83792.1 MFS transporter [Paenibacillus sp. PCH8]
MDMRQQVKKAPVPAWIIFLLASACGLIVANLYYAQTVIGPISNTTGLSSAAAGLIVTLTQVGYVIGLLFIVPLSDITENRRLVVLFLTLLVIALIAAAFSSHAILFLTASLFIGIGSVVAQILVPYATYLTSEEQRGRVVGNVMSGLLLGIMLARPVASFITSLFGWQTVFVFSAIVITLLMLLLSRALPSRQPQPAMKYGQLIVSLGTLLRTYPLLRRRALYQASLFGAFSLFWTTIPLRLAHDFGMSQQGIAWFALAGVGGAIAAPIAGRWADKGLTRILTGLAIVIAAASFGLAYLFQGHSTATLVLLVVVAITLDMAVSGNLVLGQRIIYSLGSEARGRVNGIFMSIFFIGGAIGSSLGSWSYATGGWSLTTLIGLVMPLLALVYYFTEKKAGVISNP